MARDTMNQWKRHGSICTYHTSVGCYTTQARVLDHDVIWHAPETVYETIMWQDFPVRVRRCMYMLPPKSTLGNATSMPAEHFWRRMEERRVEGLYERARSYTYETLESINRRVNARMNWHISHSLCCCLGSLFATWSPKLTFRIYECVVRKQA